jgi:hypothetical protein
MEATVIDWDLRGGLGCDVNDLILREVEAYERVRTTAGRFSLSWAAGSGLASRDMYGVVSFSSVGLMVLELIYDDVRPRKGLVIRGEVDAIGKRKRFSGSSLGTTCAWIRRVVESERDHAQ